METFDFLIIGGGIAGASVAYELAADHRVAILERESQPGYHSTGRSAALYSQTYGNAVIRALSTGGWKFFTEPPVGFAEHEILTSRGAMFVGGKGQADLLDQLGIEVGNLVDGIRRLDAREVLDFVPVMRASQIIGAVFESQAMDIDVHALHQGFLRGFRHRGGQLVTGADVRGMVYERRWQVETKGGAVAAPVVINAAGAWAGEIAAMVGACQVGLQPKRRTVITFAPPKGFDVKRWPLTIGVAEDFYFKPEAERLLGSPADETPVAPCDVQPEELDIALAVHRIESVTTMRISQIDHKWAGLRSFVGDKSPVVGFDPGIEGFFWLAGQGGYGIQTAPAMARLAAALALGRPIPSDLEDLGVEQTKVSPGRFNQRTQP